MCVDTLEDWIRPPVSKQDLNARTAALRSRALIEQVPKIDDNDVLRVGEKWLALSMSEAEVMNPLVADFRNVVSRSELAKLTRGGDARERRNALDLRILRLRRRIATVNLEIVTVWRKGYLLDSTAA
ncbi:winged helix-turn-helix domain-containing protein [Actinocrispum sp. NPDC049592]|uniref:winged helix-turn-helix domain-containing protein n=1 Tax=Actinocrispum sp. NPDC049592 TaxID=3154835 RepID=UPI00342D2A91